MGEVDLVDRFGLKKEDSLEEVFEKDEDRAWGMVDVVVVRDWEGFADRDTLFRTIMQIEREKERERTKSKKECVIRGLVSHQGTEIQIHRMT